MQKKKVFQSGNIAQSAEYAQKSAVKSLPGTHVMVERSFSSLHYTRSPRFKLPFFTQL